jgi:hypothetical protein
MLRFILTIPLVQLCLAETWVSLKYYSDTECLDNSYGVGVISDSCISAGNNNFVKIICSNDDGLSVQLYSESDCSGSVQSTVTVTDEASSCSTDMITNEYYQSPESDGSFIIDCSDNDDVCTIIV